MFGVEIIPGSFKQPVAIHLTNRTDKRFRGDDELVVDNPDRFRAETRRGVQVHLDIVLSRQVRLTT